MEIPFATKSQENAKKGFIPRSIQDKNPVCCNDATKEDTRMTAVLQRTDERHKAYKKEQAADIKAVAKLEIDILKENLRDLFLETSLKIAKKIHIVEKNNMYH